MCTIKVTCNCNILMYMYTSGAFLVAYLKTLLFVPSVHVGADAFVTISPTNDCTALVNNTSTFTFNCSGDGTYLYWTVDGHADSSLYVLNKGISYTLPVSEDGVTISSQLIVPTTKASNNTVVICTVVDVTFKYYQSSDPVKLILLGTVLNLIPYTACTDTNTFYMYFLLYLVCI